MKTGRKTGGKESMKSTVEIKKEVTDLLALKPKVLRRSAFGDDHHRAIETQVTVLKDHLSESDIWDLAEVGDWPDNVRDAALLAHSWIAGEPLDDGQTRLVDQWQELVR